MNELADGLTTATSRQSSALPDYLSIEEVANYLGLSHHTLYGWRKDGRGPVGFKLGKHLVYAREDVVSWVEEERQRQCASGAR